MSKKMIKGFFQIVALISIANSVIACDCNNDAYNSSANYDAADVVFVGRVIEINADSVFNADYLLKQKRYKEWSDMMRKNFYVVSLEVVEVSKGRFADYKAKVIKVRINNFSMASCGIEFNNYKLFRVYAYISRPSKVLVTDMCMGVGYLSKRGETTKITRTHKQEYPLINSE